MKHKLFDKIAIVSALCCALHCALLPLLLAFTALNSLQFLENPLIEWGFITLGFLFAYASLKPSLKRHKDHTPKNMAIIGLILIVLSRLDFLENMEIVITCLGSIFLIIAHLKNLQVNRRFFKQQAAG